MAKKKIERGLYVRLSDKLIRDIKVKAATLGITMPSIVALAIEEYLKRHPIKL